MELPSSRKEAVSSKACLVIMYTPLVSTQTLNPPEHGVALHQEGGGVQGGKRVGAAMLPCMKLGRSFSAPPLEVHRQSMDGGGKL